ncbi:hypothetical protein HYE82_12830 [Streptomyces sp. BR123]|uniref:hypothetical protein n=1 Tax=Streptomyces sp. BR123 TaxID=2749828 RepID=UPI0015C4C2B0|nr:hypothetical protein [Streptomyces sp. BR123]NXY95253.1 hypothetical protein [Streptomyces sp. BR123]
MDASGYAAWAAAATSMATLVVTTVVQGRREQRTWSREALTDAFVAFLAASWKHSDIAKAAPPGDPAAATDLAVQYGEMRNHLTRLRLLSSHDVLAAGERLLRLHRHIQEAGTAEQLERALSAASEGRRVVVAAGKKHMGLV